MESEPAPFELPPTRIRINGHAGDTVLDAALDSGLDLPHECGGNCACTTCHICVDDGADRLSDIEAPEDDRLSTAGNRMARSRLACQALLTGGPITITPLEAW